MKVDKDNIPHHKQHDTRFDHLISQYESSFQQRMLINQQYYHDMQSHIALLREWLH